MNSYKHPYPVPCGVPTSGGNSQEVPKFRIGKDLRCSWPILTNGEEKHLQGRSLKLELVNPKGAITEMPFSVNNNVITFTFYGKDQTVTGLYYLILWENKGYAGQTVVDQDAFSLVPRTALESELK